MDITQQLRERGLKATPNRMNVIGVLAGKHEAYSHADLEAELSGIDRVTLYRILNDLQEAGLVHSIMDTQGVTRFATCAGHCTEAAHVDEHVHFNCDGCHKVFCLEKVRVPQLKVPAGYVVKGLQTIMHGLCADCNTETQNLN